MRRQNGDDGVTAAAAAGSRARRTIDATVGRRQMSCGT